jgi:putative membrane protein
MTSNPDETSNGGSSMLDKAEDAIGAMVGMASASTLGSHDAQTYVSSTAASDLYEVEAGRIALRRTGSNQIRSFAQMLIEDHSRSSEILVSKARLAGLEAAAEPELDSRRKGMLDNLEAASAEEFDKVFLTQQAAAHREAVALQKGYVENGDNEVLKGLASGAVPPLEQHLQTAETLRSQL